MCYLEWCMSFDHLGLENFAQVMHLFASIMAHLPIR